MFQQVCWSSKGLSITDLKGALYTFAFPSLFMMNTLRVYWQPELLRLLLSLLLQLSKGKAAPYISYKSFQNFRILHVYLFLTQRIVLLSMSFWQPIVTTARGLITKRIDVVGLILVEGSGRFVVKNVKPYNIRTMRFATYQLTLVATGSKSMVVVTLKLLPESLSFDINFTQHDFLLLWKKKKKKDDKFTTN